MPGAANVRLLWPLYLTLFTTYAYTMAELEAWLLARLALFAPTVVAMAGTAVTVSRISAQLSDSKPLAFAEPERQDDAGAEQPVKGVRPLSHFVRTSLTSAAVLFLRNA